MTMFSIGIQDDGARTHLGTDELAERSEVMLALEWEVGVDVLFMEI